MTDTTTADHLDVDALAQEIRRVDGSHRLGAGALAEALMPFIERHLRSQHAEALQIAPVNNEAGSTMSIVRWQIETPAGLVGAYRREALEYLLGARLTASAMPNIVTLPAAEWSDMEYWLDRCKDKGHLENCADLLEPWANLKAAMVAARAKEGKA